MLHSHGGVAHFIASPDKLLRLGAEFGVRRMARVVRCIVCSYRRRRFLVWYCWMEIHWWSHVEWLVCISWCKLIGLCMKWCSSRSSKEEVLIVYERREWRTAATARLLASRVLMQVCPKNIALASDGLQLTRVFGQLQIWYCTRGQRIIQLVS